ncbi:hypothetical protein BDV27DRAFT_163313 [Aspergillus caelatus]|uniref:Uncharacterized protein n=1 Tax=Aspergillus caelatus TaxID=61420 RepID=A0A5N6ZMB1_9EURO|nr:uncharacterized protein BDV27DRAFT_163313 [Aspergillus caelatus]KAE8358737.1 hypothetical protein BDV27DRAFT_163313 [Aspergillus caelatus]
MAVLGRGEFGWRDPESYPPILSRVIKVARFMIVQQALWLDPNAVQIIETWQQPQNSDNKKPEPVELGLESELGLGSGSISSPIFPIHS